MLNIKQKFNQIDALKEIIFGASLFIGGLFLWVIVFELDISRTVKIEFVLIPSIIGAILMLDAARRV